MAGRGTPREILRAHPELATDADGAAEAEEAGWDVSADGRRRRTRLGVGDDGDDDGLLMEEGSRTARERWRLLRNVARMVNLRRGGRTRSAGSAGAGAGAGAGGSRRRRNATARRNRDGARSEPDEAEAEELLEEEEEEGEESAEKGQRFRSVAGAPAPPGPSAPSATPLARVGSVRHRAMAKKRSSSRMLLMRSRLRMESASQLNLCHDVLLPSDELMAPADSFTGQQNRRRSNNKLAGLAENGGGGSSSNNNNNSDNSDDGRKVFSRAKSWSTSLTNSVSGGMRSGEGGGVGTGSKL